MVQEDLDKEFKQSLEKKREQTMHIAKNLLKIDQSSKRPKAKTSKELVLYYFDYLFGELSFLEGWIPVLKIGILPHFILLFSVYLAVHREMSLLPFCFSMYLFSIVLIIFMRLFIKTIRDYFSSK